MENHPIPQDVTGFQFKLIGDMTVKQFAYLATSVIIAWVFFSLPFTAFLRIPLAMLCIGAGVSLAFLPVEGRPLDVMMANFFRALFAPNLYMYQKVGGNLDTLLQLAVAPTAPQLATRAQNESKLQQYLQSIPHVAKNKMDQKESVLLQTLSMLSGPTTASAQPAPIPAPIPVVTPQAAVIHGTSEPTASVAKPPQPDPSLLPPVDTEDDDSNTSQANTSQATNAPASTVIKMETPQPIEVKLDEEASVIEQQLEQAKILEQQQKELGHSEVAHQKVETLQSQLDQIRTQKENLEKQLVELSKKLTSQDKPQVPVFKPVDAAPVEQTQHVRKIPKGMGASVGLPITPEFPNLLVGIIKDPRGNILSQILVEVQDQTGNPVRAFKTNSLGQFAAATPLLNGTYRLVFEDPLGKQKFDAIEIVADGTIISPLEITSTDERESLRKELFG